MTDHIELCRHYTDMRNHIQTVTGKSYSQLKDLAKKTPLNKSTKLFNVKIKAMERIIVKHVFDEATKALM